MLALAFKEEEVLGASINFFLLPIELLSGFILPLTFAPLWLKRIAYFNPLSYVINGSRSLFLGNITDAAVITSFSLMVVFAGFVIYALAFLYKESSLMSAVRVLILGIMMRGKPLHGYEIKQELESWNASEWAHVAYGSIYSALKRMTEEKLIKQLGQTDDTTRVLYEIEPAGKEHFIELLRKQWWEIKHAIDPFQVALCFMNYMPKEELIAALTYRADHLKFVIASMDKILPVKMASWNAPRHIAENFKLQGAHAAAELMWVEEALEKIKKGELP